MISLFASKMSVGCLVISNGIVSRISFLACTRWSFCVSVFSSFWSCCTWGRYLFMNAFASVSASSGVGSLFMVVASVLVLVCSAM